MTMILAATASFNTTSRLRPRNFACGVVISTSPPSSSSSRHLAFSTTTSKTTSKTRPRSPSTKCKDDGWYRDQISRYDASPPIELARTPPSTWYADFHDLETDAIFYNNWIGVGESMPAKSGDYVTGMILNQPYLLTRLGDDAKDEDEKSSGGSLRGFYNVCTHAGSCLVGPWTMGERISSSLVGRSVRGNVGVEGPRRGKFQCPYHGWEFNLSGKLIKATQLRGMKDFRTSQFDLRPIRVRNLGPVAFLNFGDISDDEDLMKTKDEQGFVENCRLLGERLAMSGFEGDLQDVELVETRSYRINCNWKVSAREQLCRN
jgi:nitrite reductase/ring-hydroxylating ferredoxin subunit